MNTSKMILTKDYYSAYTDDRLFGSFVEHMGSTVYNGIFQPGHESSDSDGFRQDVIALVKELNLSMIRYPGGNFVSGFNWEDSVGPLDQRSSRVELAWKAIEPNTFGLNEFMKWIGKVGSEAIMTVNLGTRGVDAARNLVEYCNFPGDGKYSRLRKEHGFPKPYGIKTWCLGNEMDGAWQIATKTADEYGRLACEAGKAMKWVDPEIELVAVGSSTSRMSEFPRWDMNVLQHTYEVVDYISLHHYIDRLSSFGTINNSALYDHQESPVSISNAEYLARTRHVDRQIHDIIAVCDYVKSLKRSKKTLNLSFDEWNVIAPRKHPGTEHKDWEVGSPIDCGAHSMIDTLVFSSMMMSILRRADRIKIACQSLLVNTGPLIVSSKDGTAWKNAIFYPFYYISRYGRGVVCQTPGSYPSYRTEDGDEVPFIDSLVIYNEDADELVLFLVNREDRTHKIELELRKFMISSLIEHIAVFHHDPDAFNGEMHPGNVIPRLLDGARWQSDKLTAELEGYSFNMLRLSVH